MFAPSALNQKTQAGIALYGIQLEDHVGIEGIILWRATQPQGGETPRVGVQFEDGKFDHVRRPLMPGVSSKSPVLLTFETHRRGWVLSVRSMQPTNPVPKLCGFGRGR